MTRLWWFAALWFAALVIYGCPKDPSDADDGGHDAAPCEMEVALGYAGPEGEFVPFGAGDPAEIVLGYQGFRFIEIVLRVAGVQPTRVLASFTVTVEGQDPYPQEAWIEMSSDDGGAFYSDEYLVYFNDLPYSQIVGRACELALMVDGPGCRAGQTVRVMLEDNDSCIHGAGGDAGCPDAGLAEGDP